MGPILSKITFDGMFRIVIHEKNRGQKKYYVKKVRLGVMLQVEMNLGGLETHVHRRCFHLHLLGRRSQQKVQQLHRRSISHLKFEKFLLGIEFIVVCTG